MRRFPPAGLTRKLARRVRRVARRHRTAGSYRYVFIVTYGRSGSTLLMSLLNTIPGYRINGENYNALYRLYQADAAISKAHEKHSDSRHLAAQGAWYGAPRMRPERFRSEVVDSFVTHVLRPEPGDRVLGFKEIRYIKSDMPDLAGFLGFLLHTFPDCKIIFNHRNIADVAQSSWWANSGKSAEKLAAADARMLAIPDDEHHYHFSYDEIDDSLAAIRKLFAFLDEELDEPAVRRVLDVRHGPPTTYARS
jgi:sulfotransferase family protein